MSDAAALMDRMYRRQRHIYDSEPQILSSWPRRGDRAPSPRSRRQGAGDRLRHRAQSCQTGASLSRRLGSSASTYRGKCWRLRPLRPRAPGSPRASPWPRRTRRRSTRRGCLAARSFERVMISYALSMIPPWREALAQALDVVAPGGSLRDRRFRRLRRLAPPVQGGIAPLACGLRRDPARRSRRRARGVVRRARHDLRDRELVSRLCGPGGRTATSLSEPPAHPPNARDRVKIKSPTSPPTSVPLMRIYCRSLPTCSSRRLTSVAVSQLSTTAAI